MDSLDLWELKEIKVMMGYQACLDPLDQMVHQAPRDLWDLLEVKVYLVPKESVEMKDLKELMGLRVNLVFQDLLVGMVCLETVESQDQEVHKD
uniref:Uncharacterized protein n=1 Tax=Nothobranchius furzeri TaxID=105023 RepID=A0A1A8AH63_NOTFU